MTYEEAANKTVEELVTDAIATMRENYRLNGIALTVANNIETPGVIRACAVGLSDHNLMLTADYHQFFVTITITRAKYLQTTEDTND